MPTSGLLQRLGLTSPIILAPMGGGPGTPALAAAVTDAGGLGSLAGGYLSPEQIEAEVQATRALTRGPLNVNLFAGGYHAATDRDPAPILAILAEVHRELELPPPSLPPIPPDPLAAQMEAVLRARPEVFSFTFGVPPAEALKEVRRSGMVIIGTATTEEEGRILADAGADAIVAQGSEAGAHRGTFAAAVEDSLVPTLALVRAIASRVRTPVIASGGIMDGAGTAAALRAGACAVQLGTAFLLCPEAGTPPAYRRALQAGSGDETVITRAFSGRAARGIRNGFIARVGEREEAILPFPIQNTLTRPMRAAAAKSGHADYLSLWAGTGVARIRELPAAELMATLARELAAAE
jgi:nitronate monooxygenase